MQWYYANNNQRQGPIAQVDFERLVADGTIKADTLVWQSGMAEWKPYASVIGAPVPAAGEAGPTGDDTEVCAVSGKRYPRREMIQYDGKWISAEHRDTYFQKLREGVTTGTGGVPGPYGYGGFWRRFLARFLDGLILWVVSMGVNVLIAIVVLGTANIFRPDVGPGNLARLLLYQGITMLCNLTIAIGYAWFFITRFQATPGKMALGLKLVRADGSPLSVGRIFGRYFAEMLSGLILLIGYIMAGFDEEKRALHDRLCDTRVVKTR